MAVHIVRACVGPLVIVAASWVAAPVAAQSMEPPQELCARGASTLPKEPFQKMLHLRLRLRGEALSDDERQFFVQELVRTTIWSGKVDRVFIEPYDPADCSVEDTAVAEISVEVTPADAVAIREALSRGESTYSAPVELLRRVALRLTGQSPPAAENKRWLRIYYASNRRPSGTQASATAFGNERVDDLSYGALEVSVQHAERMDDVQSAAVLKIERATSLDEFGVAAQVQPLSLPAWRDELKRRAARFERPGVLLFIHGFNVSFVDAARRTAQLAYDLAFPGPTVFYAWPSDASVIQYLRDGRDARNSRQAASRLLAELATIAPTAPVYVIAHSMGNRVLTEGYLQLLQDKPRLARAFQEIVMAAPDVDQEDFRLNIAPQILSSGPRFTLYASEHDLALGSSAFVQGGKRLGIGGEALFVAPQLDSVDASDVTAAFFSLNHSYFGDTTTVLSDLFFLVRQQLQPSRRPNLRSLARPGGTAWRIAVPAPR